MYRITPFSILEIVIDHQIPLIPIYLARIKARGILKKLNPIETIEGGRVLEIPLNAPAVVNSMHINICENAIIFK
jgi:hypothetical protein